MALAKVLWPCVFTHSLSKVLLVQVKLLTIHENKAKSRTSSAPIVRTTLFREVFVEAKNNAIVIR